MNRSPDVDVWFDGLEHPLKPVMQRAREILLAADPQMSEIVQYGTVQFVCVSGLCAFVQVNEPKRVSLMFNAAGRLPGDFPHLEGKSVKYLRFRNLAEVDACADELRAIVAAWRVHKTAPKKRPA